MNDEKELKELLEKCLEGTASPEEEKKVVEAARNSEEWERIVLEAAETDALLRTAGGDEETFSIEVIQNIRNKGKSGPFARVIREQIEKEKEATMPRASERLHALRCRKRSRLRRFAAAAIFFLGIGALCVYFAFLTPSGEILTITEVRGTVSVLRHGVLRPVSKGTELEPGDTVYTDEASLCRIDSSRGCIVALNEKTGITFHCDRQGFRSLTYEKGNVFADIPERPQIFSVVMGTTEVTVLGTRFQIRPSGIEKCPAIDVFKGSVKIQDDTVGGYIREGHTGIVSQYTLVAIRSKLTGRMKQHREDIKTKYTSEEPQKKRYIKKGLNIFMPQPGTLPTAWLERIRCYFPKLLSAFEVQRRDSFIDYDNYWIADGIWRIARKGDDTFIVKENCAAHGDILFGKPEWKKGTVTVDFRITDCTPDDILKRINVCFFYDSTRTSRESFGLATQLKRLLEAGYTGWVHMKIDFRIAHDTINITMNVDPLPGIKKGQKFIFTKGPENSVHIFKRKKAGIGLTCSGVAVQFKNFRFRGTEQKTRSGNDTSGIDLEKYKVFRKGAWKVGTDAGSVYVKQTDRNSETSYVYFGKPEYTRGRLSGQVKVNAVNSTEKNSVPAFNNVGICFHYPKLKESPTPGCDIAGFNLECGVWYEFVFNFNIKNNRTAIEYTRRKAGMNSDAHKVEKQYIFTEKTQTINTREKCGIGLCTRKGVTAEWRCLKLQDTEKKRK